MAISNVMTRSLLSAGSAMKQVRAQEGIKKQMEGKAGVLKAEIKQDSGRGGDTAKKEEELAVMEKKATEIGNMQMNQLSEMNKNMDKALKADAEELRRAEKLEEQRDKKRAERREQLGELQEKITESTVSVDGAEVTVVSAPDTKTGEVHLDEVIAPTSASEVKTAITGSVTMDTKV